MHASIRSDARLCKLRSAGVPRRPSGESAVDWLSCLLWDALLGRRYDGTARERSAQGGFPSPRGAGRHRLPSSGRWKMRLPGRKRLRARRRICAASPSKPCPRTGKERRAHSEKPCEESGEEKKWPDPLLNGAKDRPPVLFKSPASSPNVLQKSEKVCFEYPFRRGLAEELRTIPFPRCL